MWIKSFLEALITAIDGKYEQNRFTKESYDALIDALNAAQSVVDSESATQQEVYEAYLALVKARDRVDLCCGQEPFAARCGPGAADDRRI